MSSSQSSDPRTRVLEVPEAVNERLLSRMLIFSLVPVFLGIVSLPLLAYIQASQPATCRSLFLALMQV